MKGLWVILVVAGCAIVSYGIGRIPESPKPLADTLAVTTPPLSTDGPVPAPTSSSKPPSAPDEPSLARPTLSFGAAPPPLAIVDQNVRQASAPAALSEAALA